MQTSTEPLPLEARQRKWDEALAVLSLHDGTPAAEGTPGEVRVLRSPGGALLARLRSPARTHGQAARGSGPRASHPLLVVFHHLGAGRFADGTTFAEGDITVCARASRWGMSLAEDFELLMQEVPREQLLDRFDCRDRGFPLVLGAGVLTMAAQTAMRAFATEFDDLRPSDLVSAEIAVTELVAGALSGGGPKPGGTTQVQAAYFHRVTTAIEARLSQPSLCVKDIARHEAVSQRYLQKLFELQNDTFTDYVRRRRLERARLDLVADRHGSKSIAEIAFEWGIRNQGHFSRLFKAAYGITPRAYRRAALRPPSDAFAAARRAARRTRTGRRRGPSAAPPRRTGARRRPLPTRRPSSHPTGCPPIAAPSTGVISAATFRPCCASRPARRS